MKRFLHVSAGVCLFLLAIATVAVGDSKGPKTITVQGLLEDDDGNAVKDSSYTIATGLWGQIIGGASLSTPEIHVVTTRNGVFTVELNESGHFMENCAPCDAWVEIQVLGPGGFETLSPRTHLSAVPHALTSAALYSEETSGSTHTVGRFRALLAPHYGRILELSTDTDGDGVSEFESLDSATTQSVQRVAVGDLNDDGVPDVMAGQQVTANGSRSWSSQKIQQELAEASMTASDSGAVLDLTWDDGSGSGGIQAKSIRKNLTIVLRPHDKKNSARMAVDSDYSEMVLEADPDADGIAQQSVKARIGDRALLGLKNYDVLRAYTAGDDITLQTDDSSSSIELRRQSSPDEVTILVDDDETAVRAAKHTPNQTAYSNFVLGANDSGTVLDLTHVDADGESGMRAKNIRKNISVNLFKSDKTHAARMAVDTGLSEVVVESDPEGDGNIEGTAFIQATTSAVKTVILSHMGIGTGQVMDSVDDDGAHMEANAQSTGSTCDFQCDVGYHRADMSISRSEPDPLGGLEILEEVTIETREDTAKLAITRKEGGSIIKDGWQLLSAAGKNAMQGLTGQGVAPGQPIIGRVEMSTTSNSSSLTLGDLAGDGLLDVVVSRNELTNAPEVSWASSAGQRMIRTQTSSASCELVMIDATGGTNDTGIVIDAVTERFGVGVSQPAHPIDHSSGAHLTAGGTWTNASDKALKENFQPVDGNDLLERIDKLQITRWNYRSEPDDVTHIGPTAQDFKHLFGVGDNDRSISTVDPSGIALAAIKELHKENDELREQNLELKNRLDELSRKLDGVLSRP